jgi:hypothetical protein
VEFLKLLVFIGLCALIAIVYKKIYDTKELFATTGTSMRKTDCIRNAMFHGYQKCNSKYPSVEADFQSLHINVF